MKYDNRRIYTLVQCAVFAAVIAVASQIAIQSPTGVPMTLQTFAIALCAFVLGSRNSTVTIFVYMLLGAVGLPVFAGFKGGIQSFIGPTGGFLWGFILMALLCGSARNLLCGKASRLFKSKLGGIILASLGIIACHIVGVAWYAILSKSSLISAFLLVSAPYLIKDAVSVAVAAVAASMIRRVTVSR